MTSPFPIPARILTWVVLAGLLTPANGWAAAWELFESASTPSGWNAGAGGSIRTVDTRSWQGARSLEWIWQNPSAHVQWSLSPAVNASGHAVFTQWVRIETPMPEARLRVSLFSTGGTRWFDFHLDFTGWRTVFMPHSSMNGSGNNTITGVRWELTGDVPSEGKLFLDQVIVGQTMDTRFQYADRQAPDVWANRPKSMWENQVEWLEAEPPPALVTGFKRSWASILRDRWDAVLRGTGTVTPATVDQWEARMNAFHLRREDGRPRSNPIHYRQYPGLVHPSALASIINQQQSGDTDFQTYSTVMLDMARGWHRTSDPALRARLANLIALMAENLLDQGWAAGSNQGSMFIHGYQSREYMQAHYLARHVLADAGLLDQVAAALQWYGQAGAILDETRAPNMDFFNTLAQGQILSLLADPDVDRQVAWLEAFAGSMGRQLSDFRPGDANGFKSDGTAFHHNGHYPAYAIGAISTLGQIFELLHGTPFTIPDDGRMGFRRAVLASRHYSQKLDWPIGISGRHPFSGGINSARGAFAALALYPDPITGTPPDRRVASAHLRLWGNPSGTLGSLIDQAGITAEEATGFIAFPFANHAVYRRNNWMVSLKGYSRYVWSSEIYAADNRFGRHQSNGTAEILLDSGRAASGFHEEGWDWNRLPGTTFVHLPLAELESPSPGTLMLRSNETMAGGVTSGEEGAFGFILNESRFGHSLRARKSYFAADGFLIALGSGIESNHPSRPVETALFQTAMGSGRPMLTFFNGAATANVAAFPWEWQTTNAPAFWIRDTVGNGYWIAPGHSIHLKRANQDSLSNKTKSPTNGDFTSGWLSHGTGPSGAGYEYVILPQRTVEDLQSFHQQMLSGQPAYEVLRRDENLHAVRLKGPERLGLVAFAAGTWDDVPHLREADRGVFLWVKPSMDGSLQVHAANPDLNPGEEDNLTSPTAILWEGLWQPVGGSAEEILFWHEGGNTRLVLPAREGVSMTFRLEPVPSTLPWPIQTIRSGGGEPVNGLRQAAPGSAFLSWDPTASAKHGYLIERMFPPAGDFEPLAFVNAETTQFFDRNPQPDQLAYYRVRGWNGDGLSQPGRSLLVHASGVESAFYDFRNMESVDELEALGWIPNGVENPSDWFIGPLGMYLYDNSSTLPATVTVPFTRRPSGRVNSRMGVTLMANFNARLELMAGSQVIGNIQFVGRTNGFLDGETRVDFSDVSWDIGQGPMRDVSFEWTELPDTNRIRVTASFVGTTPEASAENTWEIANTVANHPDRVRFSVGFGEAVNRGGVYEYLEILATAEPSMRSFFQSWAGTLLGNRHAPPDGDETGDGLSNLWHFLWALNPLDPRADRPSRPLPQIESAGAERIFTWELPAPPGVVWSLEGTEDLTAPWTPLSPSITPLLPGRPGWMRLRQVMEEPLPEKWFHRLVLAADWP